MVAKKDKTLKDIVKERMGIRGMNIQDLSKETGIPATRIYKWYSKDLNPKYDDVQVLQQWLNSNNGLEQVPRETLGPSYRDQLWLGKVLPTEENYIPLIPYKARAGYSRNYESDDYIKTEFETYPMPPGISPRGADWRWFEVGGTSMFPVLSEGDYLLCSLVPHADWMDIEEFKIYVVVWKNEVSVKRVVVNNGDLVLVSENEEEEKQRRIQMNDVKEIWKVRRRITAQLPPTKRFKITV